MNHKPKLLKPLWICRHILVLGMNTA